MQGIEQMTENRGQRTDARGQRTKNRGQMTDARGQMKDDGRQMQKVICFLLVMPVPDQVRDDGSGIQNRMALK